MSLFNFKKKNKVKVLKNRSFDWNRRPVDYNIDKDFLGKGVETELIKEINRFRDGALDDGNGNVLDTKIIALCEKVIMDLKQQRVSHLDIINELDIRLHTDYDDICRQIQSLKEHKESLLKEFKNLKEIIESQSENQKEAIMGK